MDYRQYRRGWCMSAATTLTETVSPWTMRRNVSVSSLCSKTEKALYDEKTKLWCNGPAYIAELYREELKKSGYQI